jgi:hypothetical protein
LKIALAIRRTDRRGRARTLAPRGGHRSIDSDEQTAVA